MLAILANTGVGIVSGRAGEVEVFDLLGHPTASRCYAWSHTTEGERRRFAAVLGIHQWTHLRPPLGRPSWPMGRPDEFLTPGAAPSLVTFRDNSGQEARIPARSDVENAEDGGISLYLWRMADRVLTSRCDLAHSACTTSELGRYQFAPDATQQGVTAMSTTTKQAPDDAKLKELMLYVASKSERDPDFGVVKLNKILFFSDFMAYRLRGRSITGQPYMKLDRGPAPRYLVPIRRGLCESGSAALKSRDRFGLQQDRLFALREADLSLFSADDISLVDYVIEAFHGLNGTDVSDLSHQLLGWQAVPLKADIPYETALVVPREPTERVKARALELAGLAK